MISIKKEKKVEEINTENIRKEYEALSENTFQPTGDLELIDDVYHSWQTKERLCIYCKKKGEWKSDLVIVMEGIRKKVSVCPECRKKKTISSLYERIIELAFKQA